jgi:hypothetical protein
MRYTTALLALWSAAGIAGCTTQPIVNKQVHALEIQVGQAVAIDSVNTMSTLYPPAQTQLVLSHSSSGEFGSALVGGLREHGYAVVEPDPAAARKAHSAKAKTAGTSSGSGGGLPFDYRVTQVDSAGLYELVLTVGSNKLARMYFVDDKRISCWRMDA